jgi:hypothetical protein
MEKILFIVPPYVSYENFIEPSFFEATMEKNNKIYKNLVVDMPLGVLSLSAYLKHHLTVDIKVIVLILLSTSWRALISVLLQIFLVRFFQRKNTLISPPV